MVFCVAIETIELLSNADLCTIAVCKLVRIYSFHFVCVIGFWLPSRNGINSVKLFNDLIKNVCYVILRQQFYRNIYSFDWNNILFFNLDLFFFRFCSLETFEYSELTRILNSARNFVNSQLVRENNTNWLISTIAVLCELNNF